MKKIIFLFILFTSTILCLEAQSEGKSPSDTQEKARMELQLQGARKIQQVDPDQAVRMLTEIIQASKKADWPNLQYESASLLANIHLAESHHRRAANAAEDALAAAKALQSDAKTLTSLQRLKNIYEQDGRSRRLDEVQEEYTRLKTALDLKTRNQQYSRLENTYVETTAEMKEIMNDLDEAEIARRLLENTALNLRNKNLETELELAEEAKKVMALNAKTKAQQTRLLQISLMTIFIILLAAGWIWVVRNKRKQDAQQAFLKQQLLQKDKMATLGEMTAGVAHEIKNPLNFVNNFAEGSIDLLEDLQETIATQWPKMTSDEKEDISFLLEELRQNAKDIYKQGKRADSIINGMMNHARGESSESSLADVNTLLKDSWEFALAGTALNFPDLEVQFESSLSQNLPKIRVIPQDLNRVFLNVFNNSLEAFAERQSSQPQISVNTSLVDDQIQIKIKDNGGGVPKALQEKVFNPFFTTKPTGKGNTGLGLSIAHDIVEKGHDGTITLQSDEEKWTEILILLPVVKR